MAICGLLYKFLPFYDNFWTLRKMVHEWALLLLLLFRLLIIALCFFLNLEFWSFPLLFCLFFFLNTSGNMSTSLCFNLLLLLPPAVYFSLSSSVAVSSATYFFNSVPYVDSATSSSRLVLRILCFSLGSFWFYTFDSCCTSSSTTASASSPSLLLFLFGLFIGYQL